ncbi:MAG: Mur ligase family protein [Candidatus Bipolaricaulia bacterium]
MGVDTSNLELEGKKVTVIGAKTTGKAVCRFLVEHGALPFVSEAGPIDRDYFDALDVEYEENGHTDRALYADWIVLSPGVPLESPIVKQAKAREIPVMGEIELAYRFRNSERIIAVTGTNGKTTTTRLIEALLRGHRRVVAGNIGTPFISVLDWIDRDTWVILEISSFQLETIDAFRPHISLLLNVSPDHLDRHSTLARYTAIKRRIMENQTRNDCAVVSQQLPFYRELATSTGLQPRLLPFDGLDLGLGDLDLPEHLAQDVRAALQVARLVDPDVSPDGVLTRLMLPHRLEPVAEIDGVRFYNDSKATNVGAAAAAICSFKAPLLLILGGRMKQGKEKGSLQSLCGLIRSQGVKAVLLVGEARDRLAGGLRAVGYKRFRAVEDLNEAVEQVFATAEPGDVVLLSPACASYDMFQNYRERGRAFKSAVYRLKARHRDRGGA